MRFRPPRRLRMHRPWSVPLAYAVLSIALGFRGPQLGTLLFGTPASRMSADSAIALLASVGTGMMALTGVVFSLVFVGLQFGSTAYSPRLADELGSQRILPHALGVFSGTFLYCTLAIRSVDLDGSTGITLPAVMVAFFWLAASVLVLILLVPQIQGLTISTVLDRLGTRAMEDVPALLPPLGAANPALPSSIPEATQVLRHTGPTRYLVAIHERALVDLASRRESVVRIPHAIGDPILPGEPLVEVSGTALPEHEVRRAILLGKRRRTELDPMYVLRLLSDIAIRALSPAVNDPTTAVMALDRTQGILLLLGRSELEARTVVDDGGALRLAYSGPTWDDAVALALSEIVQFGSGSPQVQRRLGALIRDLLAVLPEPRLPALRRVAERRDAAIAASFPSADRQEEARGLDRQGLGHTVG